MIITLSEQAGRRILLLDGFLLSDSMAVLQLGLCQIHVSDGLRMKNLRCQDAPVKAFPDQNPARPCGLL